MAKKPKYLIGIDLGGTKIFTTLLTKKGKLLAETKMPTQAEQGPMKVIERIAETVATVLAEAGVSEKEIIAIGVGAPGPLNPDTGIILNAPNLPGWQQIPLASILTDTTGVPTFIENDVNAGTYGEYQLGAGQGYRDIVGAFVGTGIGGGLIIDGKLRSGFRHAAAELGHMVLVVDGPYCGCGRRGCLEAVASRTAIERDLREAIQAGRESVIADLLKARPKITSGILLKALEANDALTIEVLSRVQYYLGIFVANVVNFMDPEMVILGGGVVEALGEDFMQPIREIAMQYYIAKQDADKVKIVQAKLGDYAVTLGAAMLAQERAKQRE